MNKKKKVYMAIFIIIAITLGIIGIKTLVNNLNIDFSVDSLRLMIDSMKYSELMFIMLWCIRLISLIPGVTLMVLGGLIFEPEKAVILSLVGVLISGIIVFAVARISVFKGLREKINEKHPQIIELIDLYNYKILAVGVLCPVAPTDVLVFVSSYMGISLKKFSLIFTLANMPAIFLYSYLGESFDGSIFNTIMIVITLIITGAFSIKLWNEMKYRLIKDK
ncbi:VTT domain-containing protein [Clostridium sp. 1001271B_151109_B4]|uniref:VTT domain-containing protein n=1 Tax=Clostridium sp. 1001271B_151109_B4 TaxID=2787148 RepID=UPI0018A8E0AE